MKKILPLISLLTLTFIISGCAQKTEEKEEDIINPFSVPSMVNTYENSKEKINDSVQKENEKLNNALLEESGLNDK